MQMTTKQNPKSGVAEGSFVLNLVYSNCSLCKIELSMSWDRETTSELEESPSQEADILS